MAAEPPGGVVGLNQRNTEVGGCPLDDLIDVFPFPIQDIKQEAALIIQGIVQSSPRSSRD